MSVCDNDHCNTCRGPVEGLKKAEMDLWPTTGAAFRFPVDLLAMTAMALLG